MLEFTLFRVKVTFAVQATIFDEVTPRPRDVLDAAVVERPSVELRKGYEWHIGNVERLEPTLLYFAFGRITKGTVQYYDQERGNFVEVEFETAPYTHVLLDTGLSVAAIARNSKLAPSTAGIGRQLQNLLGMSKSVDRLDALVEVAAIRDPEEFITQLKQAFAITRFTITFGRPNPFDVQEDFHGPMERLLQESHGKSGKATVKGDSLDPVVLEPLARSAAATGNDASATLQRSRRGRPVRRGLKDNPATVTHPEPVSREEKQTLADIIRDVYRQIRQRNRD